MSGEICSTHKHSTWTINTIVNYRWPSTCQFVIVMQTNIFTKLESFWRWFGYIRNTFDLSAYPKIFIFQKLLLSNFVTLWSIYIKSTRLIRVFESTEFYSSEVIIHWSNENVLDIEILLQLPRVFSTCMYVERIYPIGIEIMLIQQIELSLSRIFNYIFALTVSFGRKQNFTIKEMCSDSYLDFQFLSSNIQLDTASGVYISQLIRYSCFKVVI